MSEMKRRNCNGIFNQISPRNPLSIQRFEEESILLGVQTLCSWERFLWLGTADQKE